jgi:hypothetical protein
MTKMAATGRHQIATAGWAGLDQRNPLLLCQDGGEDRKVVDEGLDLPVEVGQVDLFVGRMGVVVGQAKAGSGRWARKDPP